MDDIIAPRIKLNLRTSRHHVSAGSQAHLKKSGMSDIHAARPVMQRPHSNAAPLRGSAPLRQPSAHTPRNNSDRTLHLRQASVTPAASHRRAPRRSVDTSIQANQTQGTQKPSTRSSHEAATQHTQRPPLPTWKSSAVMGVVLANKRQYIAVPLAALMLIFAGSLAVDRLTPHNPEKEILGTTTTETNTNTNTNTQEK